MMEYPEQHMKGYITIENRDMFDFPMEADLGLMVSHDGRVWLCINGIAFLRFTPHLNRKMFPDPEPLEEEDIEWTDLIGPNL